MTWKGTEGWAWQGSSSLEAVQLRTFPSVSVSLLSVGAPSSCSHCCAFPEVVSIGEFYHSNMTETNTGSLGQASKTSNRVQRHLAF